MGQLVMAKCSERCGWLGPVRTGWVPVSPLWVHHADVPENRLRTRGGVLEYRRRLRDAHCPTCKAGGLDRCQKVGVQS